MECEKVREIILFVEKEEGSPQNVKEHLRQCAKCRTELEYLKNLKKILSDEHLRKNLKFLSASCSQWRKCVRRERKREA